MDEQTGQIQKLEQDLIKRVGHLHEIPVELLEEVSILQKEQATGMPVARMTGDGKLSQFRQDLARRRRIQKKKRRANRKNGKRQRRK